MSGRRADNIAALRQSLVGLKSNFDKLVTEQRMLGFDENQSLRSELRNAGNVIERAINKKMTWLTEADARQLMIALSTMLHYEAVYRLEPSELAHQQFLTGYRLFNETFAKVEGTPAMNGKLEQNVKHYAGTFARWIKVADRTHALQALIDMDSQNLVSYADVIIRLANDTAAGATAELSPAQASTRTGIIAVGFTVAAFSLLLS